jgi:hypothetical protein
MLRLRLLGARRILRGKMLPKELGQPCDRRIDVFWLVVHVVVARAFDFKEVLRLRRRKVEQAPPRLVLASRAAASANDNLKRLGQQIWHEAECVETQDTAVADEQQAVRRIRMPILGLPIKRDGLQQLGISGTCRLGFHKAIRNPWISPCRGAARLRSALRRNIQEHLTDVGKQAAHRFANVVGNNRAHRLEAPFGQGCLDGVAAACTDPEKSDPRVVDIGKRRQMIDSAMNVFDPNGRIFEIARFASTFALV